MKTRLSYKPCATPPYLYNVDWNEIAEGLLLCDGGKLQPNLFTLILKGRAPFLHQETCGQLPFSCIRQAYTLTIKEKGTAWLHT